MKTTLALLLVLILAAILFFPSIVNQHRGITLPPVESTPHVAPSKPEITEQLLVEGKGGDDPGQATEEILDGYTLARQQKISSHANCILMDDLSMKDGCHRYVNDQQLRPPYINRENSLENISANQCRTETAAYYEAVEKDMHQQSMAESILGQLKADWLAELDACNNYPYKALGAIELQPIIQSIEQTGDVKPEDLRAVLIDVAEKRTFAEAGARADYIKNIENLFPADKGESVTMVDCERSKQQLAVLSESTANINTFKQSNLELWSSVVLQRKILLWKKLLITSAATCEATNES